MTKTLQSRCVIDISFCRFLFVCAGWRCRKNLSPPPIARSIWRSIVRVSTSNTIKKPGEKKRTGIHGGPRRRAKSLHTTRCKVYVYSHFRTQSSIYFYNELSLEREMASGVLNSIENIHVYFFIQSGRARDGPGAFQKTFIASQRDALSLLSSSGREWGSRKFDSHDSFALNAHSRWFLVHVGEASSLYSLSVGQEKPKQQLFGIRISGRLLSYDLKTKLKYFYPGSADVENLFSSDFR